MVKPIYFPHTYISPATAAAMRSVFAAVVGYQPAAGQPTEDMAGLVEGGFLEIVAPAAPEAERLERVVQELEQWGRRHSGGAGPLAAFLSSRRGSDPLTADGSAAQIASEIRRRPADPAPAAQEALLRAAVFLQLAHQADQQGYQVRAELRSCARAHAELLGALAGEEAWPSPAPHSEDLRVPEVDLLLSHRIQSWARLFLQRPYASPVFVTTRREVIDRLAEKFPTLRRIGRSALDRMAGERAHAAPPAAGDLMAQLELLASRPLPDAGACDADGNSDPAVHVVPDVSPLRLFARLAESEEVPAAPAWRHTVVVELPLKK